jgi:hypothetical protein
MDVEDRQPVTNWQVRCLLEVGLPKREVPGGGMKAYFPPRISFSFPSPFFRLDSLADSTECRLPFSSRLTRNSVLDSNQCAKGGEGWAIKLKRKHGNCQALSCVDALWNRRSWRRASPSPEYRNGRHVELNKDENYRSWGFLKPQAARLERPDRGFDELVLNRELESILEPQVVSMFPNTEGKSGRHYTKVSANRPIQGLNRSLFSFTHSTNEVAGLLVYSLTFETPIS